MKIVLEGVEVMPTEMQQHLLSFPSPRFMNATPFILKDNLSEDGRTLICDRLGKSIGEAWHLFHTSGNAQVLAVDQALLHLLQQNHSILFPTIRSVYDTAVYNLIGLAWHFQEHHQIALEAHVNAHMAAMSTGDPSYIMQSLIRLSNAYQALEQPLEAIQALEEALRLTKSLW